MGGHYEKDMYRQLSELLEKVDALEADHKKDHKEIRRLTDLTDSLEKENRSLKEKVVSLESDLASKEKKIEELQKENQTLRDDNERMKRTLNNNSGNSSMPPSKDEKPTKAANTYNSRKPTERKPGAQAGHSGKHLSKSDVEQKIKSGEFTHKVVEIGDPAKGEKYVSRYKLDLSITPLATEYRIYADENGHFSIPSGLTAEVTYGESIQAVADFLYSEGIVANDRICTFINSLSGGKLNLSEGSVYNFCRSFGQKCKNFCLEIEQRLLNAHEICTDATPVTTDGKQSYVRNFSTEKYVLYCSSEKKDLETLKKMPVLSSYAGILTHDHETALFHFGTGHGDCNVHLIRYLQKNTEETGNQWSRKMIDFLTEQNEARSKSIQSGCTCYTEEKLTSTYDRYDAILREGEAANPATKGKWARKEEKALLNRLTKYRENFLLFLNDFQVHFSDNMSEKDLRIIKGREKMAGGFRKASGREMYCQIISFIETVKRQKLNIYDSIINMLMGKPVIK